VIVAVLLSACTRGVGAARAGEAAPPAVQLPATSGPAPMFVTRHAGSGAADTAQVLMVGPLVSTAGWTAFMVSYQTNVDIDDRAALGAQSDSVLGRLRAMVAERPDTTVVMSAQRPADAMGRTSGFRFVYRKLPDGSWARLH